MSSEDAEQWVNVPDDFFKEPYRTVLNMGSDVQGGNNPFDPFLNTESSEDLDRAYLMLMGYSQAGKKGLAQGFFKFKDEKGIPKDRENLDITLNPDEVSAIFSTYSSVEKKGKVDDKGNKDAAEYKKVTDVQGGRIENRKYFQLNWELRWTIPIQRLCSCFLTCTCPKKSNSLITSKSTRAYYIMIMCG
jgi:hypothetical protein